MCDASEKAFNKKWADAKVTAQRLRGRVSAEEKLADQLDCMVSDWPCAADEAERARCRADAYERMALSLDREWGFTLS